MPTTYTGTTGTGVTSLVQTAYDRLLEFQLRAMPLFRSFADKKPGQQAMPGSSVVFQLYNDLAVATTALTENVDPDAVALGNTNTVTVTLNEYGNVALATRKLEFLGLSDIDPALANIVAFNMADSVDILAQRVLVSGGVNVTTQAAPGSAITAVAAGSGALDAAGSAPTIAAGSLMSSGLVRYNVTKLRANKVVPRKANLYAATVHPEVSVDLRAETGNASWRDPHIYSAPDAIFAGEIGAYEGAFFVENPRVFNTQIGVVAGSANGVTYGAAAAQQRVFNSYFMGQQALAEGVGDEPHMVIGPVVDKLMRYRPIGWYALLGWQVYRSAALYTSITGSSIHPQT